MKKSKSRILGFIDVFVKVCLSEGENINKAPYGKTGDEMQPIIREATIYDVVNDNHWITQRISFPRNDMLNGREITLEAYVRRLHSAG